MFSVPIPRRSILDSRLRAHNRQNRRLARGGRTGDTHLGLGPRVGSPASPNRICHRTLISGGSGEVL